MKTRTLTAAAVLACLIGGMATQAQAGEPIEGKWRAPDGGIVQVDPCGSEFCATVVTGQHKGKAVGRMAGSGTNYEGTVTDPREDKTYTGTVEIADDGNSLKLEGCALKVFCKAQTWTRA